MSDRALTERSGADPLGADPLIDPTELEAIVVEILDVLVINAGMDPDAPLAPEPGIEPGPLHGRIEVHAGTVAFLVIESDTRSCATLARCWGLSGPDGTTPEDAADALGELCNLVGATVKTVFDEESHVGIPEVVRGPAPGGAPHPVEIVHTTGRFAARFQAC